MFLIMVPLWPKLVIFGISGDNPLSEERVGVKAEGGSGGIVPTLCVEFCLVNVTLFDNFDNMFQDEWNKDTVHILD